MLFGLSHDANAEENHTNDSKVNAVQKGLSATEKAGEEQAPKAQTEQVEEQAPKAQTEQVEEQAPKAQTEQVEEQAPKAQTEQTEEQAPKAQANQAENHTNKEKAPISKSNKSLENNNEENVDADKIIEEFAEKNQLNINSKNEVVKALPANYSELDPKDLTDNLERGLLNLPKNNIPKATKRMARSLPIERVDKLGDSVDTKTETLESNVDSYGDVVFQAYPNDLPKDGVLAGFNSKRGPGRGTSGAVQYKKKIDFSNDFKITVPVANNHQGNTTASDGWGFIFTDKSGEDFLKDGGILRDKGIVNSAGFKIDTSYNNYRGQKDPLDTDKKRNIKNIGGASFEGYGTFVKNDETGITTQVGTDALNSKDNPKNLIKYADNNIDSTDGKFHGQNLNDVVLTYNSKKSVLQATYAGKTWEATLDQLGIEKSKKYNFLITSSVMDDRFSNTLMRANIKGASIETPIQQAPIIKKEDIPFNSIREVDVNKKPGTQDEVIQRGEKGEKTIEISPDGSKNEKVIKQPKDEIIHYAPETIPHDTKKIFDPNVEINKVITEEGYNGLSDPEKKVIIKQPKDEIIKYGPKEGNPQVTTEEIPFEKKREFNPNLAPGTEKVKQEGRPGEKTITTPILVNPITGEKVGVGKAQEEVTKAPVDEIVEFGGEEIPQNHKDEFDPNVPVGEKEEVPGHPGVKNPETGEIVTPPVDDITKYGPKEGNPQVTTEEIPFEKKREFNPNLAPGTEKVKQEGRPGEKTITTPILVNPITGEKVGVGKAQEEVTKAPVDEIVEFGGEEIPQNHKDEFDPNVPVGEKEEVPGHPGVKNPETGEIVTPPVDDITKYGPKEGNPQVTTEEIPFEKKRELDLTMSPGSSDKVVQEGRPGEKTITTPILVNPITGEKVGVGKAQEEVTKAPVDQIIHYAPEIIPHGSRKEYDPSLSPGEIKIIPGKNGLRDPETGEIIEEAIDEIIKYGPAKPDIDSDADADADSDSGTGADSDSGAGADSAAHHSSKENKSLPNTGYNSTANEALFGSLLATIGSIFLLRNRRKKENEK
ncbi:E domain-containing protein [Staphylococcus coagulans]|uniref:E domain-containing protein n=1 Tax=Staphylococcus coagulans TaxID=74706 RepID=UPI00398062FE